MANFNFNISSNPSLCVQFSSVSWETPYILMSDYTRTRCHGTPILLEIRYCVHCQQDTCYLAKEKLLSMFVLIRCVIRERYSTDTQTVHAYIYLYVRMYVRKRKDEYAFRDQINRVTCDATIKHTSHRNTDDIGIDIRLMSTFDLIVKKR